MLCDSTHLPHRGVRAKSVLTASNAAYGVVSRDLQSGGGGGDVAMYEMVGQPPSVTPTAHPPSGYLYPSSSQGPTNTQDPVITGRHCYVDTVRPTFIVLIFPWFLE